MNRTALSILLVGVLALSVVACSERERDQVVNVPPNDPEMLGAIAQARSTLPAFWQVFERPEHGESNFVLKVLVTDKRGEEYFWATDLARRDGKILGTIDNDPNIVGSVKFGDRIEISEGDISDWAYMRNGKMVGNLTVRPLFKRMPASEVERIRKMLADP
jgi:uncharacterized protein YegJ (DUF2314 family)